MNNTETSCGAVEELFTRIEVNLTKQATRMRKPIITAKERMRIVLRFPATGKSQCLPKSTRGPFDWLKPAGGGYK